MAFLHQQLRRGGWIFLCSTPSRAITNPGTTLSQRPFNRHHVREYERDELDALLGRHFARVEAPRRPGRVPEVLIAVCHAAP